MPGFENGNPYTKHFNYKCGLYWFSFPTKGNTWILVHVTVMLVTNACDWCTCVLAPRGHPQSFWNIWCGDDDYWRGLESQYPIVENHMSELACPQDAMFVIMCTRCVGKTRGQRMWWLPLDKPHLGSMVYLARSIPNTKDVISTSKGVKYIMDN